MIEIGCYELNVYEVKIENKPIRKFYTEEEALKFIEKYIDKFVFMRKIEYAVIE